MKKIRIKFACLLVCLLSMAGTVAAQDEMDKARDLANQGRDAEDKGDYDKAIQYFNASLQLGPDKAHQAFLHTELGNVYFSKEDYATATKEYEAAIQIDPTQANAFIGRGNVYDETGDPDKALADYSTAIRLAPKNAIAYINRAVTYNRKEMNDEAIADCNTALGIDPASPDAYEDRAIGYDGKGEYDKAIADYNKVLELDPKYAEAYANRARDYRRAGAYDKALADLNKAIEVDQAYRPAYNGLAWLLATCPQADIRDGKKAVACALKACEMDEWKKAADVDTLAAAYAEAGDFDAAVKFEQWYLGFDGVSAASAAKAKERLALYQARKPWHEAVPK